MRIGNLVRTNLFVMLKLVCYLIRLLFTPNIKSLIREIGVVTMDDDIGSALASNEGSETETASNDKEGKTKPLPITRRSVLRGAATVGPVAGLASSDEAIDTASATSGSDGSATSEPDGSATVTSPDGSVEATVEMVSSGDFGDDLPSGQVASLTANYDGTTVLDPSPLGLTTYTGQFVTSLSLENTSVESVEWRYETVGGDESGEQALDARIATLTFGSPNGSIQFELLASNQGIAYRYRLPGEDQVLIDKEVSAFQIPSGTTAWLQEYGDHYESVYKQMDVESAGGDYGFPCLFEADDDVYALLTEANVGANYCASHVAVDGPTSGGSDAPRSDARVGEESDRDEIVPGNEEFDYDENRSLFEVRFAGVSGYGLPSPVSATLPLTTPWRTMVMGDLSTVVETNLITALNDPSQIDDTSWIEPGIADWSWWSDGDSPRSLESQKRYVDYAAERGWSYTLVDRGWRREWMPELVEYADERGIDILVWMVWTDLNTEIKREVILPRLESMGISGVKIDYMDSDRQERMEWYEDILAATAEHELLVNFHGSTLPKGRRRTWPHLMTSEAVYGAEQYKWTSVPASHGVALPFTRNVVGPMDYTPVTFSTVGDTTPTSLGHQLALSVVYQSDLQHFADSIDSYRKYPTAERFLSEVAAVWDETVFVDGYPTDEATIARRSDNEWFLGSIIAGEGKTIDAALSFLPSGREYKATIISDNNEATAFESRERVVTADDSISAAVPKNGGFVARLTPTGSSTHCQIDFIKGQPLKQLGENGLYAEQDRLLRFAVTDADEGIVDRGSAWASADIRDCLAEYGHINRTNDGEATVTFTVAKGCELTLSLVVHSMSGRTFSRETADQQKLLNTTTETFGPGEHALTVSLPTNGSA
jgi:alpha-glucosidase